ncbi:putative ras family gtp-binding protein rho1p [Diaporthe ampelina]|uniref:Putative ras family gtp-binding protein rho1p n=1 Tax=Diaporthe ampelina TaxID=1214573 RepID=A0A0G2FEP9_9PEZI|nr:putative ras family gtp-binding protein rho1p [Diaporthe ampelina]
MGTPAGQSNSGRKSSASVMLRDMGRSSKEFFSKLTMRKREEYNLRVAFIGNQHCGKDVLLSRYTLTASTGNIVYRPDVDSFRVKLTGVFTVDNYKARTEIWDIAHRNVKNGQVHPLSMASFDVVVVCVDIGDQRNLKSVAKRVAQRYCPGVPSIVLGLKSDLRPNFPTLRLGFLQESTAFTVGQGEETARMNKASAYYECSAKTGEGVTEFFESLARFTVQATRTRYKLRQKASRGFSDLFRKK